MKILDYSKKKNCLTLCSCISPSNVSIMPSSVDIDIVSINQNVIDIAAHLTQDHSPLLALTDANEFQEN